MMVTIIVDVGTMVGIVVILLPIRLTALNVNALTQMQVEIAQVHHRLDRHVKRHV